MFRCLQSPAEQRGFDVHRCDLSTDEESLELHHVKFHRTPIDGLCDQDRNAPPCTPDTTERDWPGLLLQPPWSRWRLKRGTPEGEPHSSYRHHLSALPSLSIPCQLQRKSHWRLERMQRDERDNNRGHGRFLRKFCRWFREGADPRSRAARRPCSPNSFVYDSSGTEAT